MSSLKVKCRKCGNDFTVASHDLKRGRGKFCSHKCAQDYMKKENHPCWKGRKLKTCPICRKDFLLPLGRFKTRITCSKLCYRVHLSRNFNRDRSHLWRGGVSRNPYASEFNSIIKKDIRRKQGGMCGVCHSDAHVKNLHIHHIDYDKKNTEENNLIGLCKSCHSKTNFNRAFWKEFFTRKFSIEELIEFLKVNARYLR